jgi:hypothetical protein
MSRILVAWRNCGHAQDLVIRFGLCFGWYIAVTVHPGWHDDRVDIDLGE